MKQALPVYILSGFLGSGKTTLLQRLLDHWKGLGLKPAVVMNELGEVNLDGLLVEQSVPMAEMLGGCICCSIRGDLSTELATLVKKESPDVVVIEATGAANPLEIIDGVTETSLYQHLELKGLITVVDAAHLLELYRSQQGATYRLMQEQIRCASVLLLNKTDRVTPEEAEELTALLRKWNAYAEIIPSVRCEVEPAGLLDNLGGIHAGAEIGGAGETEPADLATDLQEDGAAEENDAAAADSHHGGNAFSSSHDHVMAYTHYFTHPVDSVQFEQFVKDLPRDVYRAKGIVSFSDTSSRFLFQYAYREADFMKITPQGEVPDVAVFIGEHFSSRQLRNQLLQLEGLGRTLPGKIKRSL
ncbi:GTP-binding protein [Paenibacillus sp. NFR01]|uniref:CobW family GTP-binding protein n=1 Tax=Paenibacillus sp. NFR01 TaxID=1566279 RepID=UPI0008BC188E|nr:GTP-binding protein [Paenibacillus sp. NFR01]SET39380.1 GTPase, G3E family [Paenibacillus sp. NFR01]